MQDTVGGPMKKRTQLVPRRTHLADLLLRTQEVLLGHKPGAGACTCKNTFVMNGDRLRRGEPPPPPPPPPPASEGNTAVSETVAENQQPENDDESENESGDEEGGGPWCPRMKSFAQHTFKVAWRSETRKNVLKGLLPGHVFLEIDYAANYTVIVDNATQSMYFSPESITILNIVVHRHRIVALDGPPPEGCVVDVEGSVVDVEGCVVDVDVVDGVVDGCIFLQAEPTQSAIRVKENINKGRVRHSRNWAGLKRWG